MDEIIKAINAAKAGGPVPRKLYLGRKQWGALSKAVAGMQKTELDKKNGWVVISTVGSGRRLSAGDMLWGLPVYPVDMDDYIDVAR